MERAATATLEVGPLVGGEGEATVEVVVEAEATLRPSAEVAIVIETIGLQPGCYGLHFFFLTFLTLLAVMAPQNNLLRPMSIYYVISCKMLNC